MRNKVIGIFLFFFGIYGMAILTSPVTHIGVGEIGKLMKIFFLGSFGVLSYVVMLGVILYAIGLIGLKNVAINQKKIIGWTMVWVMLSMLLTLLSIDRTALHNSFLDEFIRVGKSGESGGMVGALMLIILYPFIGKIGLYLLTFLLAALSLLLLCEKSIKNLLQQFQQKLFQKRASKTLASSMKPKNEEVKSKLEVPSPSAHSPSSKINKIDFASLDPTPRERVKPVEKKSIESVPKNGDISENMEKSVDVDAIFGEKKPVARDGEKEKRFYIEKIERLEGALTQYGITATVVNYEVGPVITRFELSVEQGTRVKRVSSLADDIAMNLEAKSIRIEAPIPGKNLIGIEVPNKVAQPVFFSEIVKDKSFMNSESELSVILGKDIVGKNVVIDLKKMPHLLVAGRTGSGKSVGLNTLISSILLKSGPDKVRFIMVDPKMVELMPYNDIKHLLVPVITEPKLAAVALRWAVNEMEERYKKLSQLGVRNIEGYNQKKPEEHMYYIVIIIDEFADLMMVAPGTLEESIARIAQKARAVGIHLVMATQRPSTDVITGTIKANLPSRIAFSVASGIDSRTILDHVGAEKLLGRGDMLYSESSSPNLVRIQGAFISDDEVIKLTDHLKKMGAPEYNEEIICESSAESGDVDELYEQALSLITGESKVSTSYLQRKLKIGYSRAARIVDQLMENGVINENKEVLL